MKQNTMKILCVSSEGRSARLFQALLKRALLNHPLQVLMSNGRSNLAERSYFYNRMVLFLLRQKKLELPERGPWIGELCLAEYDCIFCSTEKDAAALRRLNYPEEKTILLPWENTNWSMERYVDELEKFAEDWAMTLTTVM